MEGRALTLRQALQALWRQRLIVVAAVVIALLAAAGRLYTENQSYAATATARLATSVSVAAPAGGNDTGSAVSAPDLSAITSSVVAADAASLLDRAGQGGQLAPHITSSYDSVGNSVAVTATTGSSAESIAEASAFAQAYANFLKQQRTASLATVQNTLSTIAAELAATKSGDPLRAALTGQQAAYYTQLVNLKATPDPPVSSVQKPSFGAPIGGTSKAKTILIALAIGLIAGVGLALLRDQFDTRVRGVEAAEELTGRQVLSQLPYVRKYRRGTQVLAVVGEPHGRFAGAVRELRTSAGVLLADVARPVIVLTSSVPNEGKSLIAANLAASWAMSGKRTVVVNGDLRRPHIQGFFRGRASDPGLADLLRSNTAVDSEALEKLLLPTSVPGLLFLPAGRAFGDPADDLASTAMASVMQALREVADIAIIDTPPVTAASDAAITAELADGAIFVVRAHRAAAKEVTEAMKRLSVGGTAEVIGVALNGMKKIVGDAYGDYYRTRPESAEPEGKSPAETSPGPNATPDIDPAARPNGPRRFRRVGI